MATSLPRKAPVRRFAAPAKPEVSPSREKYAIKDLQASVSGKLSMVSRATVDKVIVETFLSMSEAFLAGKMVTIKDFGKLELRHRPERQARNPSTGETITVAAKTVPKFTFAKSLKDAAN